jgi:hypothetical protein
MEEEFKKQRYVQPVAKRLTKHHKEDRLAHFRRPKPGANTAREHGNHNEPVRTGADPRETCSAS